jgi:hypothetical protein
MKADTNSQQVEVSEMKQKYERDGMKAHHQRKLAQVSHLLSTNTSSEIFTTLCEVAPS